METQIHECTGFINPKSLLLQEVELMETSSKSGVSFLVGTVASFIGSGINGNSALRLRSFCSYFVASFIGSGINGNRVSPPAARVVSKVMSLLLQEVELMETGGAPLLITHRVQSLLLQEVELMETFREIVLTGRSHSSRFFYRKWN